MCARVCAINSERESEGVCACVCNSACECACPRVRASARWCVRHHRPPVVLRSVPRVEKPAGADVLSAHSRGTLGVLSGYSRGTHGALQTHSGDANRVLTGCSPERAEHLGVAQQVYIYTYVYIQIYTYVYIQIYIYWVLTEYSRGTHPNARSISGSRSRSRRRRYSTTPSVSAGTPMMYLCEYSRGTRGYSVQPQRGRGWLGN